MIIAGSLALNACNGSASQTPLIGKNTAVPENDLLSASVLNSFGRVSDPQVSPDGKQIVYGVSYISVETKQEQPRTLCYGYRRQQQPPNYLYSGKRIQRPLAG